MWSYKPKLQMILASRLACQLSLTRAGFLPSKNEADAGQIGMTLREWWLAWAAEPMLGKAGAWQRGGQDLVFFLFLAAPGLHCCSAFSLVVVSGGLSLLWLLWLQSTGSGHAGSAAEAFGPQSAGSLVVLHGLGCSTACKSFPDQGSNLCPCTGRWILKPWPPGKSRGQGFSRWQRAFLKNLKSCCLGGGL